VKVCSFVWNCPEAQSGCQGMSPRLLAGIRNVGSLYVCEVGSALPERKTWGGEEEEERGGLA